MSICDDNDISRSDRVVNTHTKKTDDTLKDIKPFGGNEVILNEDFNKKDLNLININDGNDEKFSCVNLNDKNLNCANVHAKREALSLILGRKQSLGIDKDFYGHYGFSDMPKSTDGHDFGVCNVKDCDKRYRNGKDNRKNKKNDCTIL